MFFVIRLLIVAALGAGLGLGSAYAVLVRDTLDAGLPIGPWRVETTGGPEGAHPYATARHAREGRMLLGAAEGVAFRAASDSDGLPLDPACHYRLAGPVPPAELWTLAVTDLSGRLPVNPARRTGFTSFDAVRTPEGTVEIVVGRTVRPGNFVATQPLESLAFTLRVYGPGLTARLPTADQLPEIRRMSCPQAAS